MVHSVTAYNQALSWLASMQLAAPLAISALWQLVIAHGRLLHHALSPSCQAVLRNNCSIRHDTKSRNEQHLALSHVGQLQKVVYLVRRGLEYVIIHCNLSSHAVCHALCPLAGSPRLSGALVCNGTQGCFK